MKRPPMTPPDLAGFRHLRHLGGGGFADVFEYEDALRRHVAVKVLLAGLGEDRQLAFEDEARRMAQLSNHPSIVSIYQAGAAPDGRPFLVMEYCPPPELWQRVRERPLSVAKTLEIGIQIAGAVESAHRLQILHRDIKPANILFTEFGHPALTDFGIAASTVAGESGQTEGLSVPWAPPEQLTPGMPMGAPGDVYSLAATLWTCLAGQHPFYRPGGPNDTFALSARIKSEPPPRTGREDVPESLERILAIALDKRPERRYLTPRDFALALQGVQAELHLPITANDIRATSVPTNVVYEEDDGHTRISAILPTDPDGSATAGSVALGTAGRGSVGLGAAGLGTAGARPSAPPDVADVDTDRRALTGDGPHTVADLATSDSTVLHVRAAGSDAGGRSGGAAAPQDARPRSGRARTAVLAGAAVLAIGAGGVVISRSVWADREAVTPGGSATTSSQPADPIAGIVPQLTGEASRGSGSRVVVTVSNPAPMAGDSYTYQLVDLAGSSDLLVTEQRTTTIEAPAGRACVDVALRRATGRTSKPTRLCTKG